MDIRRIFDHMLPAALAKNADEARTIDATYQVTITDVGDWFLDLTNAGPRVEQAIKPADCTVTLSATDFEQLARSPASAVQLFFAGRLKVKGSPRAALKLQKLFSLR